MFESFAKPEMNAGKVELVPRLLRQLALKGVVGLFSRFSARHELASRHDAFWNSLMQASARGLLLSVAAIDTR